MNRVEDRYMLEDALERLREAYNWRRLIPRRWMPGNVRLPRNKARTGRVIKVWCKDDDASG